jgi:hypothetical protein
MTRFEDDKTNKMATRFQKKKTRRNNLYLLAEVAKSVFQGEISI